MKAAFRIGGEGHAIILCHRRQQLGFHPIGIAVRDGVVFQPTLGALRVAAAGIGKHHDHRRQAFGGNHVVQNVGHALHIGMAVLHHHEGRIGRDLAGDIDIDMALIAAGRRKSAGRYKVIAPRIALHVGDAHDARIELAVLGIQDEFAHIALGYFGVGGGFRRHSIVWPDDAVFGADRRRRGGKFRQVSRRRLRQRRRRTQRGSKQGKLRRIPVPSFFL